jgi:undecaprenyl-diphosphatase
MTTARVLTDPRVRLGAGTTALLVTAMAARRNRVGPGEAAAFRAVNNLPGWLYPPAWAVMQLGALGAAPAAAGAAWLAGDHELAGRLLAGGTSAWALSKVVKRLVQRPRPAAMLPGTRRRGRDATGLGYLSGHAGVAVALGAAVLPRLGPGGRILTLAAGPVVGLTRIYVGAHLRSTSPAERRSDSSSMRTDPDQRQDGPPAGRGLRLDGPARTGLGATKACE